MPKMHSRAAILAAVAATCVPVATTAAQQLTRHVDGSASYTWDGSKPLAAESHLITSIPNDLAGANVAPIIGADTFYSHGYDGTGTIASNIEAGHIWGGQDGHHALEHVTSRTNDSSAPGGTFATPAYDRHATWVGLMIGGRLDPDVPHAAELGIAPGTDLRSGAIATAWGPTAYATSFSTTGNAMSAPYATGASRFGVADVINSSWGGQGTAGSNSAAGTDLFAMTTDGLANQNRFTTFVASAGNSGESANPRVATPASGYNDITVGALANDGSNNYNTVAAFSSRGPQEYGDPNGIIASATARRAVVDIVAPGTNLTSAYYGGQTGGNDASLPGSAATGGPFSYQENRDGTSFSAPIVAGSVALMHDAAAGENLPADARDTRVIKANLLNAARKIPGWNNGQAAHPNGNGGVRTTQALDFDSGAGALDLTRTYDQYLTGQTDLPGTAGGITTEAIGWDFGLVGVGDSTDIVIDTLLQGGSEFRVTLAWFRDRTYTNSLSQTDVGMANLNLEVWDSTFTTLISDSVSQYNTVEHLAFTLPEADGLYGLRIAYPDELFGTLPTEEYGIAWWGSEAVPEPASLAFLALAGVAALRRRRR